MKIIGCSKRVKTSGGIGDSNKHCDNCELKDNQYDCAYERSSTSSVLIFTTGVD